MFSLLAAAALAAQTANDIPPYPEIVKRIEARDAALFWFAFEGCNAQALADHLHDDFRMLHDLAGLAVPSKAAFVESIAGQCAARAPGGANEGYKNRRLITPGTRIVRQLGDWGALEEASHSFFEYQGGEWVQTGGARYMHVWQWMGDEDQFRLLESLSYDHGATLPYPSTGDDQ